MGSSNLWVDVTELYVMPMPTGMNSHDGVASAAGDAEDALLNQAYQAHVDHTFYEHQCDKQLQQTS